MCWKSDILVIFGVRWLGETQESFQGCQLFLDLDANYMDVFSFWVSIELYTHDLYIFLYVYFNKKL